MDGANMTTRERPLFNLLFHRYYKMGFLSCMPTYDEWLFSRNPLGFRRLLLLPTYMCISPAFYNGKSPFPLSPRLVLAATTLRHATRLIESSLAESPPGLISFPPY